MITTETVKIKEYSIADILNEQASLLAAVGVFFTIAFGLFSINDILIGIFSALIALSLLVYTMFEIVTKAKKNKKRFGISAIIFFLLIYILLGLILSSLWTKYNVEFNATINLIAGVLIIGLGVWVFLTHFKEKNPSKILHIAHLSAILSVILFVSMLYLIKELPSFVISLIGIEIVPFFIIYSLHLLTLLISVDCMMKYTTLNDNV